VNPPTPLRLCSVALWLPLALACVGNTSPGEGANPPPPPSHTPTGLRHAPNTGVYPMSNELSEEEAAKLTGSVPGGSDDSGESEEVEPEKADE
jgi:hypothetical protein